MSVAFSVGSFGDILATIQLVVKATAALQGATSEEQRSLRFELQALGGVLLSVQEALEKCRSGAGGNATFQNLEISISQEVTQCQVAIRKFVKKAESYQKNLGRTSIANVWWGVWWSAIEAGEISQLRATLAGHQFRLALLLISLDVCVRLFPSIFEINVVHSRGSTAQVKALVKNSSNPSPLPDTVIVQKCLRITGAFDKEILVSLDFCMSWAVRVPSGRRNETLSKFQSIQDVLTGYFARRPGRAYIVNGAYDFVDPTQNRTINATSFTRHRFKHGMALELCVISRAKGYQEICPRCRAWNRRHFDNDEWITWCVTVSGAVSSWN